MKEGEVVKPTWWWVDRTGAEATRVVMLDNLFVLEKWMKLPDFSLDSPAPVSAETGGDVVPVGWRLVRSFRLTAEAVALLVREGAAWLKERERR